MFGKSWKIWSAERIYHLIQNYNTPLKDRHSRDWTELVGWQLLKHLVWINAYLSLWNFSARLCASVAAEYTSPYLTSQTAPESIPKSSEKYTSVCVAGLCCMCPCWHSSTPWKIWHSLIQNHPWMLRVTPFIYKESDRFTDSTTKHESSQKTKVNWKLFQGHFLVFFFYLLHSSPFFHCSISESSSDFPTVLCLNTNSSAFWFIQNI